ncbi:MAG: thioredoxin family protein [Porphyromonadaceae bacterium]|nr:MAG: thioredoxin family protein [Porphyromonadaceae bacterium]
MSLTTSNPFPLGSKAPDFMLPDTVSGKILSLTGLKSDKATVIMFICNHCPYVKHVNKELVAMANKYIKKGVSFIGINSNDARRYPDDSPEQMTVVARKNNYPFPYLFDKTQEVAQAFDAACTPEFYVFNKDMSLVYHGQMDDSRPSNNIPVTGEDLAMALDLTLAGKPIQGIQKPGIGCGIKWL